jgi:hypothetical protein
VTNEREGAERLTAAPELPANAEVLSMSRGNLTLYVVHDRGASFDPGRHYLQVSSGPHRGEYAVDVSDSGGLL